MKRSLVIGAIALAIIILAPNLIWLGTSTVRIKNVTENDLASVSYKACDKVHPLGKFEPHEAKFRLLESCGDDTLVVLVNETEQCREYVEGDLYHVDARIFGPGRVECTYRDFTTSLFIAKLL